MPYLHELGDFVGERRELLVRVTVTLGMFISENLSLNVSLYSESVDQVVERYGLQKITLLREISIKTGIQVRLM